MFSTRIEGLCACLLTCATVIVISLPHNCHNDRINNVVNVNHRNGGLFLPVNFKVIAKQSAICYFSRRQKNTLVFIFEIEKWPVTVDVHRN